MKKLFRSGHALCGAIMSLAGVGLIVQLNVAATYHARARQALSEAAPAAATASIDDPQSLVVTAASPSSTVLTRKPSMVRKSLRISRMTFSSSTTRILGDSS